MNRIYNEYGDTLFIFINLKKYNKKYNQINKKT